MACEYCKTKPVRLREIGKDEKWLQDLIARDPSILDLGDVELFGKEKKQPSGGRIDMILKDATSDTPIHYEVEIMLGSTDESHIIRCLEYWDIESRRYPSVEHRAVIVAENITNRFFNVIGLLNKSIPIIAIKLHAVVVDDKLCLSFIKVMDVMAKDEVVPDDDSGGLVDRNYWVKKGREKSLTIIDAFLGLLAKQPSLRVKFNRSHVAIGTTSSNFLWLMPRKGDYILIHVYVGAEARTKFMTELGARKIECEEYNDDTTLAISPTLSDIKDHAEQFKAIFDKAEQFSRE